MGCDQVDHTMAAHNEYQEREYDEKYQGSGLHGRCSCSLGAPDLVEHGARHHRHLLLNLAPGLPVSLPGSTRAGT